MKRLTKRTIFIGGRKTTVSLEDPFWSALKEIASERRMTMSNLATEIGVNRQSGNLSSAIRVFMLAVYQDQIANHPGRMQMVA